MTAVLLVLVAAVLLVLVCIAAGVWVLALHAAQSLEASVRTMAAAESLAHHVDRAARVRPGAGGH